MTENGQANGNGNGNGNGGELTGLQRAFVDAWFACRFNGVEAARQAGYRGNDNVLANVASVNLRKPKIRAAVAERWAAHGASGEEVLSYLADWMRFDSSVLFDEAGLIRWDAVKKHGRFIKRIEYRKGVGYKIELHDPMRAAELIGKFLLVQQDHGEQGLTVIVDI